MLTNRPHFHQTWCHRHRRTRTWRKRWRCSCLMTHSPFFKFWTSRLVRTP